MITAYNVFSPTTKYTPESPSAYVSVLPTDTSKIVLMAFARALGYELTEVEQNELHCTLIISKEASPSYYECKPLTVFGATLKGFEYWPGHDKQGYLVAVLTSKDLVGRHEVWEARGARHSFQEYTPHVTLKTNLAASTALYKRMQRLSNRYRDTPLEFLDEKIIDVSW